LISGTHVVFKDANIVIERGQKVAFVGKNGEGKSTMIKAIMKEIGIDEGSVEIGHNSQISTFSLRKFLKKSTYLFLTFF
jgi:ATP-binding cassette subfamily F protein 3